MIPNGHIYQPIPVTLTLDGLVVNAPGADVEHVVDTIEGWHGAPGVKNKSTELSNRHGSFAEEVFRQSRLLSLEGSTYASDRTTLLAEIDRMSGVLSRGKMGLLEVVDPVVGRRHCQVQLTSAIQIEELGPTMAEWKLELLAPDPIKYGDERTSSIAVSDETGLGLIFDLFTDESGDDSSVLEFGTTAVPAVAVLRNEGTADVWPTFSVSGPCDNFEIYESTSRSVFSYSQRIERDSSLSILPSGAVLLDGVADRSAYLTRRDWWRIPAGGTRRVSLSATGGSPLLTVRHCPGWW